MNIEHIKEWVAALRSGDYAQGDGMLLTVQRDPDGGKVERRYCCLGVGCELAGLRPDVVWDEDDHGNRLFDARGFYRSHSELPPSEFAEWLGFDHQPGDPFAMDGVDWRLDFPIEWENTPLAYVQSVRSGGARLAHSMTCASLNDAGFTFAQIADCIDYFGLAGPN